MCKKTRKKYGKLPTKEIEATEPWERVNIDMIGPLTVKTETGKHSLSALTMIDPATGWFEISEAKDPKAATIAQIFDHYWLSRYPRPRYIGFDNGSENKAEFKEMILNFGLTPRHTTTHNPQANGIIERIHGTINDMIRTYELEDNYVQDQKDPWSDILSAVAYAVRSTAHTVMGASPGQMVFGRDMLLPIRFETDWALIRQRRLRQIEKDNKRENKNRKEHEYSVGDKVLYNKHGILRKLTVPRRGPYEVTHTYRNGTIRIQRGAINERVNIRHVTPYIEPQSTEANVTNSEST